MLTCATPGCGARLERVPGSCPGCGTFWGSSAHLEVLSRRATWEEPQTAMPMVVEGHGGLFLACGHPGEPGTTCEFCGRSPAPSPDRSRESVCIVVGGMRIGFPPGTEITLGRHSEWAQVADAFNLSGNVSALGVSRRHASIVVLGERVKVTDLRSLNGTWIDGRELVASSVVRALPLRLVLGLPEVGLVVDVRAVGPSEAVATWSGLPRE